MRRILTALAAVGLAVSAWFTVTTEPPIDVRADPGDYCC